MPLQSTRKTHTAGSIVGRDREIRLLREGLSQSAGGSGQIALISGPAGIGKTALAQVLATAAADQGFLLLWGRCWEEGGSPAFWPWTQMIRRLVRRPFAQAYLTEHQSAGRFIGQIAGEVPEEQRATGALPDETSRFALFDAVAEFLVESSEQQPLLLVVDDAHAADLPSLLLLQHVARRIVAARIHLVVTHRQAVADLPVDKRSLLQEIDGARISLTGLGEADIRLLLERADVPADQAAMSSSLLEVTEGNPLFVVELIRDASSHGLDPDHSFAAATGVRDVIVRRVDLLPPDTREALGWAAVMGRDFRLLPIGAARRADPADVAQELRPAVDHEIVVERDAVAGRFAFSHALVRDVVYERLTPDGRRRMHRALGSAFMQLYEGNLDPYLSEIARHLCEGIPPGDAETAISISRRAAARATAQFAYEEAANLLERVLVMHGPPGVECEVLLELADARWKSGQGDAARELYLEASTKARELGNPTLLARAATGYAGPPESGVPPGGAVDLLREAEQGLAPELSPSTIRIRARAQQIDAIGRTGRESVEAMSATVDAARKLGDAGTHVDALRAQLYVLDEHGTADEMLAATDHLLDVARRLGDPGYQVWAHGWRVGALLIADRFRDAEQELGRHDAVAEQLRQPFHQRFSMLWRAALAIARGRSEELDRAIPALRPWGWGDRAREQLSLSFVQLPLKRYRGQLEDLEADITVDRVGPPLTQLLESATNLGIWAGFRRTAYVAIFQLWRGRLGRAEPLYREALQLEPPPHPGIHMRSAKAMLSAIAIALEDRPTAERLFDELSGESHGVRAGELVYCGPIERYLGELAAFLGRDEEALKLLDQAIRKGQDLETYPELVLSLQAVARFLVGRGEIDHARDACERALVICADTGLDHLANETRQIVPPARPAEPSQPVSFVRSGEFWTVGRPPQTFQLRHSKGLAYLATLLAEPGRPWRAIDLGGIAGDSATEALAAEQGDVVLDEDARTAYRKRIAELERELAAAEDRNDIGSRDRARAELDFLQDELKAALGLGGKPRSSSRAAERARLAVSKAIRTAIRRVEENDPQLGWHLRSSVRTGHLCSYEPGPADRVTWQL